MPKLSTRACRQLAVLTSSLFAAIGMTDNALSAEPWAIPLRQRMVAEIAADARATASHTGRPVFAEPVMAALGKVERHRFVPSVHAAYAYENRPLPIGQGQTISQPYIVALMTDVLDIKPTDVVLEIGTGSGYQAAVLAALAQTVYTIEIVAPLGQQAASTFARLGLENIVARIGDGYGGWPEAAPFDAIMVTAAPTEVPQPLIQQLKPGGRLVVPVGPRDDAQELLLIEKRPDGSTLSRRTLPVRFVPLTRSPGAR